MSEASNSPDNPVPSQSSAADLESALDDNSDESPKSEAAAVEATQVTEELMSADSAETGWTEDSGYQTAAPPSRPDEENLAEPDADWDDASLDWTDDLTETVAEMPQPTTTQEALAWMQPTWQRFQQIWRRLILGVRRRIPAAANLSDKVLSTLIIGTLVLLLILLNSVRQPAAARVSQSETLSGDDSAVNASSQSSGDAETQAAAKVTSSGASTVGNVDGERIAQIQAQLTDNSILNAQRVIDSVQADFINNRLTLIINGDWYRLSPYDQTQLAQALMAQSASLSFADLQFMTADGDMLARSPVVGQDMVILQREPPPEVPIPEKPRYRIIVDR
ncbi:MAG: hypothetical protein ACFB0E_21325 [Leptolyngbyaceae cyanobacterium]